MAKQYFLLMMSLVWVLYSRQLYAGACLNTKALPVGLKSMSVGELKQVQQEMKSSNYLSVDFVQTVFSPLRNKTRRMEGHAYFAKPAKVRWNKSKPKEEIIFNGKDLYMYKPDEKSAFKYSAKGSQAAEFEKLTSLVLSLDQLLDRYELMSALKDTNQKVIYVSLAPKKDTELSEVVTEIGLEPNLVRRVCLAYKDEQGAKDAKARSKVATSQPKTVTYEFSNQKVEALNENLFTFDLPKGVKLEVYD